MPSQGTTITKEDLKSFKEEIVHQFHVSTEGMRDEVRQLAEGVVAGDERIERSIQEFKEEIDNKIQPIGQAVIAIQGQVTSLDNKVAGLDSKMTVLDGKVTVLDGKVNGLEDRVTSLDGKVTVLDGKVTALDGKVTVLDGKVNGLDGKITSLDAKVDRIHLELKTEIQETRQEILAAVKFSYAELDKRLTTLENEFLDLKLRVEKIEKRPSV